MVIYFQALKIILSAVKGCFSSRSFFVFYCRNEKCGNYSLFTIQHLIEGEFTVTRASVDSQEYTVTYTGKGKYSILANIIKKVTGVDADNLVVQGSQQYIIFDNVINDQISQDGEVTLKYTTRLE